MKAISTAAVASNSGVVAAADLLGVGDAVPTADTFVNLAPLAPNRFYPLPLGAILPKGWLLDQLRVRLVPKLVRHYRRFEPAGAPGIFFSDERLASRVYMHPSLELGFGGHHED